MYCGFLYLICLILSLGVVLILGIYVSKVT